MEAYQEYLASSQLEQHTNQSGQGGMYNPKQIPFT